MQARFRKVAVFVGAAALAGGVAAGVASQGGADAASPAAATAQRGDGPRGLMDVSALADALGVSTAKLQAALEAARPNGDPRAHDPGEDPIVTGLADQLGMSTEKVRAALEAVRPARGGPPPAGGLPPDGAAPPGGSSPPASSGSTTDTTPA